MQRARIVGEDLIMRVLIAGGSGLIGRHLSRALLDGGHQPIILSRDADHLRRDPSMWPFQVIAGDPTTSGRWQEQVDGCDAVVNLAGHNIFNGRWSPEIKRKIRDSRVHSAENLVAAIKQASSRPKAYIQGSAIGFYGPQKDQELTESSPSGTDFLAVVCRECEEVSHATRNPGCAAVDRADGDCAGSQRGRSQDHDADFQARPGRPDRQRRRHDSPAASNG